MIIFVGSSLPEKGFVSHISCANYRGEGLSCPGSGRYIFFIQGMATTKWWSIYDSQSYTYFSVEEIKHIALHFIFSCTCGGSLPKPSKTQACMHTLLLKATRVVVFDNIPHQKHWTENTETDTGASNQVQIIPKACWWYRSLFFYFINSSMLSDCRWDLRDISQLIIYKLYNLYCEIWH